MNQIALATSRFISSGILFLIAVVVVPPSALAVDLDELAAEIDVSHARWVHAFRTQDAEKVAALFDPEGALLGANGSITYGHKDILASMKRWMTQIGSAQVEFNQTELWQIGSMAYEAGTFSYKWQDSTSDPELESKGTYLMIWKTQADGSWLIYRSIPLPE